MQSTDRYVWVPAHPCVRDREASDLFDSGVIVAGCTMALLIMLVVAWLFN
jgi:hypothetical protein